MQCSIKRAGLYDDRRSHPVRTSVGDKQARSPMPSLDPRVSMAFAECMGNAGPRSRCIVIGALNARSCAKARHRTLPMAANLLRMDSRPREPTPTWSADARLHLRSTNNRHSPKVWSSVRRRDAVPKQPLVDAESAIGLSATTMRHSCRHRAPPQVESPISVVSANQFKHLQGCNILQAGKSALILSFADTYRQCIVQRLHEARVDQAAKTTEQSSKTKMVTVPPFRVLPVQVVLPVQDHSVRFYSTTQAIPRPRTVIPETSKSQCQASGAPAARSPRSQYDCCNSHCEMQCSEYLDSCQPMTHTMLIRSPLDHQGSFRPTMDPTQQPWPLSSNQWPNTSASEAMLLDKALFDLDPKEWAETVGQAPAVELGRATGATGVSFEGFSSSLTPLTSSEGLYDYREDDARYRMDSALVSDADEVTEGE